MRAKLVFFYPEIVYYLCRVRNTTKLKILLQKYTVSFDMDEDEQFTLVLIDKNTNHMQEFEGKSYSIVLAKAYSYLLKVLKHPVD